MKKFKLGVMVGRFQMLHKGHEALINEGLELCERFVVLLGNSEESRTKDNPFNFAERNEMIKTVYGNKVEVYPIISIGIGYIPAWGNYIMNTVKFYCGEYPDFVLRGSDDGRSDWIDKTKYNNLTEYIISRNLIKINATEVRNNLLNWYTTKVRVNRPKGLEYYEDVTTTGRISGGSLIQISGVSRNELAVAEESYKRAQEMLNENYTDEMLERYAQILYYEVKK